MKTFYFHFKISPAGELGQQNRRQWHKASLRKELQASHMVTEEWERETGEMAGLLQGTYLKGTENIGGKLTPHGSKRVVPREQEPMLGTSSDLHSAHTHQ